MAYVLAPSVLPPSYISAPPLLPRAAALAPPAAPLSPHEQAGRGGYVASVVASAVGARTESVESVGVAKSALIKQHVSCEAVEMHYEDLRELGSGSFGSIALVRDRETAAERVRKAVSTAGMKPKVLASVRKEIELLARLDHPNIVRLYEWAEDTARSRLTLILEYVPGGDCAQLLDRSGGCIHEGLLGSLLHQTLLALAYCHPRGVIHRDVKPENLMLLRAGAWGDLTCKLIDFGLAVQDFESMDFGGTPAYMAPEVASLVLGEKVAHTAKADMWSLGVTALEMVTGTAPFGRPNDFNGDYKIVLGKIKGFQSFEDLPAATRRAPGWLKRSGGLEELLGALLQAEPERRANAADALAFAWVEQHQRAPAGLTSAMIRSLASYTSAPPLVRCCLLAIATRKDIPDRERLGAAFLAADADGDGRVSSEDLEEAVRDARTWWWDPDIDVHGLLRVANLDHGGGLSFTEFVAACLYARYKHLDDLIDAAFEALDTDRAGLVNAADIRKVFRERDYRLFQTLPQDRPFDRDEWRRALWSLSPTARSGGGSLPKASSKFFGSSLACTAAPRCESAEGEELEDAMLGRSVSSLPRDFFDSVDNAELLEQRHSCGSFGKSISSVFSMSSLLGGLAKRGVTS
eukprot:TRINITY_DN22958_c1_g2_i1.p1 TRINITY_DN22958_c1_g2~~TRINITY_DN22958_c1_g2_i1.p1  ORF type:complete len:644 (+),score=166.49 TRINITY_DN22958_c1_g2_i1:33-1934(+)